MLFRMSLASWYRTVEIVEKAFSIAWNKRLEREERLAVHSRCAEGEHTYIGSCLSVWLPVSPDHCLILCRIINTEYLEHSGALKFYIIIKLIIWYLSRIYMTTNYNLNYMMFEIYICILCYFVNLTINWYWRWPDCDRNIYDLYIINVNI